MIFRRRCYLLPPLPLPPPLPPCVYFFFSRNSTTTAVLDVAPAPVVPRFSFSSLAPAHAPAVTVGLLLPFVFVGGEACAVVARLRCLNSE